MIESMSNKSKLELVKQLISELDFNDNDAIELSHMMLIKTNYLMIDADVLIAHKALTEWCRDFDARTHGGSLVKLLQKMDAVEERAENAYRNS